MAISIENIQEVYGSEIQVLSASIETMRSIVSFIKMKDGKLIDSKFETVLKEGEKYLPCSIRYVINLGKQKTIEFTVRAKNADSQSNYVPLSMSADIQKDHIINSEGMVWQLMEYIEKYEQIKARLIENMNTERLQALAEERDIILKSILQYEKKLDDVNRTMLSIGLY